MFKERRRKLLDLIKKQHPNKINGAVLLIAAFESEHYPFRQESTFYYFTGINEPGVALWLTFDGHATLFIPNHGTVRKRWAYSSLDVTQEQADAAGVDVISYLGDQCKGYQAHPFFKQDEYKELILKIKDTVDKKEHVFSTYPKTAYGYVEQRHVLNRLQVDGFADSLIDVSGEIAQLRRKKDMREVEDLFKAIEITTMAHEAAAHVINDGVYEFQVQAALEFIFTDAGAQGTAFPSIVGSGPHSTILHYQNNDRKMKLGDLVVVDIGAYYNHYGADLTRTYPVSGTFTDRQKEIYNIVLDTHEYIAGIAKPGYWLNNKNKPEKSLHHLAQQFLQEVGYKEYFHHGIGHFLGLDVHDVGDPLVPLQEYDVITIEPGIYIPDEQLGVRIEDNYLVVKEGVVRLSEDLPLASHEIEKLGQKDF